VSGSDWLPIQYFASKAGLSREQVLAFIDGSSGPPKQRALCRRRLSSPDEAYSEATGPRSRCARACWLVRTSHPSTAGQPGSPRRRCRVLLGLSTWIPRRSACSYRNAWTSRWPVTTSSRGRSSGERSPALTSSRHPGDAPVARMGRGRRCPDPLHDPDGGGRGTSRLGRGANTMSSDMTTPSAHAGHRCSRVRLASRDRYLLNPGERRPARVGFVG